MVGKAKLDISKSLPNTIYKKCNNKQSIIRFLLTTPIDENDRINTNRYDSLKENIEAL